MLFFNISSIYGQRKIGKCVSVCVYIYIKQGIIALQAYFSPILNIYWGMGTIVLSYHLLISVYITS